MDEQYYNVKKIFSPSYIHPEEEPDIEELNDNVKCIAKDIESIDASFIDAGIKIKNLLDNTKLKLKTVHDYLSAEKERQEDVNILCNRYTEFAKPKNIDLEKVQGNLIVSNGVISAAISSSDSCNITVTDVTGNGYEGNSYVYANTEFTSKSLDSSKRTALTDGNLATYYEYSRITTSGDNKGMPSEFNRDSMEASCSIEINSETLINKLLITSDRDDIVLSKVYRSDDGLVYKLEADYNIAMNNRQERYNNQGYVFGSGIIAVTPSKYLKLMFKSGSSTNDTIAYIDSSYSGGSDSASTIQKIVTVKEAKRHVVRISEIVGFNNKYTAGMIVTDELITSPVTTVALYCNEYINNDYDISNNVRYFLIVNGEEHEVTPINAERNGKKILRSSVQSYKSDHIEYLSESIKSAKLKIVIDPSHQDVTPYISDVKLLIGGSQNE